MKEFDNICVSRFYIIIIIIIWPTTQKHCELIMSLILKWDTANQLVVNSITLMKKQLYQLFFFFFFKGKKGRGIFSVHSTFLWVGGGDIKSEYSGHKREKKAISGASTLNKIKVVERQLLWMSCCRVLIIFGFLK